MHGNRISCETNAGTRIKIDIGLIYSISRNTAAVCVYRSLCFTKVISIINVTTLVRIFCCIISVVSWRWQQWYFTTCALKFHTRLQSCVKCV